MEGGREKKKKKESLPENLGRGPGTFGTITKARSARAAKKRRGERVFPFQGEGKLFKMFVQGETKCGSKSCSSWGGGKGGHKKGEIVRVEDGGGNYLPFDPQLK